MSNIRQPSPTTGLMREIANDLADHFHGEATYAELKEWLGPEDGTLGKAILDLLRRERVSLRLVGR